MTDHQQQSEVDAFLANDFVGLIRAHDRGRFITQLENDLHKVVQEVKKHNKKGSVKITLEVTPADEDVEQASVTIATNLTLPRPPAPPRQYFVTGRGGLSRSHPNQLSLDLGE